MSSVETGDQRHCGTTFSLVQINSPSFPKPGETAEKKQQLNTILSENDTREIFNSKSDNNSCVSFIMYMH